MPRDSHRPAVWQSVLGSDLLEIYQSEQPLSSLVPASPGVYLWKMSLVPSESQQNDSIAYTEWLDRLCTSPHGKIFDRQVAHFIQLSSIELRGRQLTDDKHRFFSLFTSHPANRRWLTRYLSELSAHLPSLYVGESSDLAARVYDHIGGSTDFSKLVESELGLDWENLTFNYLGLPETEDKGKDSLARKSFEYLTACVTIAGYTQRPG